MECLLAPQPLLLLPPNLAPLHGSLSLPGLPVMEGRGHWQLGWVGLLAISSHLFLLPTVTPSDCYVSLWLPTASSHRLQTRTVKNCRNPIWNQSFRFRIHSQLKVGRTSAPALPTAPASPPSLLWLCSPSFSTPLSCSPLLCSLPECLTAASL